jgi:DNA repair exonuclease SbcCD nuclease subunit
MSALFIRQAKQAGFNDEQAELLDTELHHSDNLATHRDIKELETTLKYDIAIVNRDIKDLETTLKQDIKTLELATQKDIKELELTLSIKIAETHVKIAETKAELIRWVVAVGLLQITIITALILRLIGKI